MSKYADKAFWTDTIDRTIASLAQGLVVALGAVVAAGEAGLLDVDWTTALSMAGGYAVLAFLTSVSFRGNGEAALKAVSAPVEIEVLDEIEVEPLEESEDVVDLSDSPVEIHVESEEVFYEPKHGE